MLFDDAPKALLEKVEQVVRLIRSKGVGVFFITQNPADVPDTVLGQLGNRVQHALRAFTPKQQKAIKQAAETYRENPKFKVADIFKSRMCPLAKVMRKEFKRRNIKKLKVVYSTEDPIVPIPLVIDEKIARKQIPGSLSFVPSVAGLIITSEVIKDLLEA